MLRVSASMCVKTPGRRNGRNSPSAGKSWRLFLRTLLFLSGLSGVSGEEEEEEEERRRRTWKRFRGADISASSQRVSTKRLLTHVRP